MALAHMISGGGKPTASTASTLVPNLGAATMGQESPEIVRVLRDIAGVVAASASAGPGATAALPLAQPTTGFAAAAFLFLAMARGGDIKNWMGDRTSRALEAAGRGDLIDKLGQAIRQTSVPTTDSTGGDWRSFTVPTLQQGRIEPIQLHVRRGDDDEGGDPARRRGAGQRRFILDIELSAFGPVQIDGLVRDKMFDLAVRTRRHLAEHHRDALQAIFTTTSAAQGLEGRLTFQPGEHGWIKVAETRRAQTRVNS